MSQFPYARAAGGLRKNVGSTLLHGGYSEAEACEGSHHDNNPQVPGQTLPWHFLHPTSTWVGTAWAQTTPRAHGENNDMNRWKIFSSFVFHQGRDASQKITKQNSNALVGWLAGLLTFLCCA